MFRPTSWRNGTDSKFQTDWSQKNTQSEAGTLEFAIEGDMYG